MSKALVAYFSASGVTADAAKKIAGAAGADLCEIRPQTPYTEADLDWRNPASRSSKEMKDKSSRPAILPPAVRAEAYDVLFLGFPIWWYTAPTVVNTYLEGCRLAGKRVILFATSGSSGFSHAREDLAKSAPDAAIEEGRVAHGARPAAEWAEWVRTLSL